MAHSRLARLRAIEAAHAELTELLVFLEQSWDSCSQSMDQRRDSCTSVLMALAEFTRQFGVSSFANDRLADLTTAFGELFAGRTSALLQRANVPTRTLSVTDCINQAVAQVCVDLFRAAKVGANEARVRTARLFLAQGFQQFGTSKLKTLGSRLTGVGARFDPLFDRYQLISTVAAQMITLSGCAWPPTEAAASAIAKKLVLRAREMDHRLAA